MSHEMYEKQQAIIDLYQKLLVAEKEGNNADIKKSRH